MFRFAHGIFLYALILIPFFVLVFWWFLKQKQQAIQKFGDFTLLKLLMPEASRQRNIIKFTILIIAYVFIIIGLADPQIGSKVEKGKRKGIDIMIALDVSNSMTAGDIKPNRLEKAKQAISKLIDNLESDRIGIIVFAGKAYIQLPITSDYGAAKLFLSNISTDMVPTQGTAIGEAIEMSAQSFNNPKTTRVIVVISDGENHEDDAIAAANKVEKDGIFVYTIGMGLPDGAPIPIFNENGIQTGFKKDQDGSTIISKLDETMLQEIAKTGKGAYVRANNTEASLDRVFDSFNRLQKTEYQSRLFSEYEDRFQYFLLIACLILAFEFILAERKPNWAGKINLFGKKNIGM